MMRFVFGLVCLLGAGAQAEDFVPTTSVQRPHQRLIEMSVGARMENRSGWLTRERSSVGYSAGVHLFNPISGDGLSFFEFSFGASEFKAATNGGFPFAADEHTEMSTFALVPCIGFLPSSWGNLFAGVGPMHLTVAQKEPRKQLQTYGTFLWQVGGRYDFNDDWSGIVKVNYADVESTVNGTETFFALVNVRLEIALRLL